MPPKELTNQ